MSRIIYFNSKNLLNALKTQYSKIKVIFNIVVFYSKYLSWRYIYEINKFKPLFDILFTKYDTFEKYFSSNKVKRALEAHLINYPDTPKKPTVGKFSQFTAISAFVNVAQSQSKKRKRDEKKNRE
jgi:hypothetical protein